MDGSVLIVAPHPDDESIGCGGAICLHRGHGDQVRVAFLTSGELGVKGACGDLARLVRESEAREAAALLDINQVDFLRFPDRQLGVCSAPVASELSRIIETCCPKTVYLPHPGDFHPDHAAVLRIIRQALRSRPHGRSHPELRAYEVWSPISRPSLVMDISDVIVQKIRAIRCHRSQLTQVRYDRAARGLNQYRGAMLGAPVMSSAYAEAFECYPPSPGQD